MTYLKSVNIDPHCETGPLLSAEQLQSGLLRQRQECLHRPESRQHAVYDSALLDAQHRRRPERQQAFPGSTTAISGTTTCPIPYQLNYGTNGPNADEYCNICNPFQYDTSIMSHPDQVKAHIQDTVDLYADIANGTLARRFHRQAQRLRRRPPGFLEAQSFRGLHAEDRGRRFRARPTGRTPRSSSPSMKAAATTTPATCSRSTSSATARAFRCWWFRPIPPAATSPTTMPITSPSSNSSRGTGTSAPVTNRSRDNFPNPVTKAGNPYVPLNGPALDDLFDAFHFPE